MLILPTLSIVVVPGVPEATFIGVPPATVNEVTLNVGLSISLSLLSTLPVRSASSRPVLLSFTATGASFTGVMLMLKVLEAVAPSSSIIM